MKTQCSNRRNHALTVVEVVVVFSALIILAAMLLAVVTAARVPSGVICVNRLHKVGLAFENWQADHNGKFPMEVPATNGGAMEAAACGNAIAIFQVISNKLSAPNVLICPADRHHYAATNFAVLVPQNVSFFVGLDVTINDPEGILSGDDNFEIGGSPAKPGLLKISSNTPATWLASRHKFHGNLLFTDGSVQGVSNFLLTNDYFCPTNAVHMRLAIP